MLCFIALFLLTPSNSFRAPAGSDVARVVPGGTTILPNGRLLTPIGDRLYTGEDLWKVLRSPDGSLLIGIHDGGFTVYDLSGGGKRLIRTKEVAPAADFTADGKTLAMSRSEERRVGKEC